jgi:hypothetical protein
MALTIIKQPASPLLTKNEIAYKVSTNDAAVDKIVAHLLIETTPYSNSWQMVKKLAQAPDPEDSYSAWFFFHDALERVMEYSDPGAALSAVDSKVCRRVRVEFYELINANRILKAELYSEAHEIIEVDDFIESGTYLILIDYSNSTLAEANRVRIGNGINTTPNPDELTSALAIADAWQGVSDTGYQLEKISSTGNNVGYDDVVVPPKIRVRIYLAIQPTSVLSDIRYALKGGLDPNLFAEMTNDPDYWVDENLANVIDENGNLIIT